MNTTRLQWAFALACCFATALPAEPSFVPKPGSKERTAICDAVRRHKRAPKTKFVIHYLRVKDGWALFDGSPSSGSEIDPEEGAIAAVLQKQQNQWRVVGSWSHGDVPAGSDFKLHARALPDSLVAEYDRELNARLRSP
jgi:hypothetical protein